MWLNVARIRFVEAAMTLAGVAAARNSKPLESIWFDAIARFPEEAVELQDKVNTERYTQRMLSSRTPMM